MAVKTRQSNKTIQLFPQCTTLASGSNSKAPQTTWQVQTSTHLPRTTRQRIHNYIVTTAESLQLRILNYVTVYVIGEI